MHAALLLTPGVCLAIPVQQININTIEELRRLSNFSLKDFNEAFPPPEERPPFSGPEGLGFRV